MCTKSFSQAGNLKIHKSCHTQENPYQCNMCEYSCSTAVNLTKHKLVHTKVKPYQCNICMETLSQASNLKRHSFLHSEKKSFTCEICAILQGLRVRVSHFSPNFTKLAGQKICGYLNPLIERMFLHTLHM